MGCVKVSFDNGIKKSGACFYKSLLMARCLSVGRETNGTMYKRRPLLVELNNHLNFCGLCVMQCLGFFLCLPSTVGYFSERDDFRGSIACFLYF